MDDVQNSSPANCGLLDTSDRYGRPDQTGHGDTTVCCVPRLAHPETLPLLSKASSSAQERSLHRSTRLSGRLPSQQKFTVPALTMLLMYSAS
jgi:hypothetical protein